GTLVLPFAAVSYITEGIVDFALWVPALGERYVVEDGAAYPALTYDLTIEARSAADGALEKVTYRVAAPSGSGDLVFADLLAAGDVVEPDLPGALAQAQAAAASAAGSALSADQSAQIADQKAQEADLSATAAATFDPAKFQPINAFLSGLAETGEIVTPSTSGAAVLTGTAAEGRAALELGEMALLDLADLVAAIAAQTGTTAKWQDVSAARVAGTAYQNDTGHPLDINTRLSVGTGRNFEISEDGVSWQPIAWSGTVEAMNINVTIPPGNYYRVLTSYSPGQWMERR
ncbi:hypothetical protein SAMN05877809_1262, partial [Rhodobacter sp. JA431]